MEPSRERPKSRIPWVPIVLLVLTAYLFWVLPSQLGQRPVHVDFESAGAERR